MSVRAGRKKTSDAPRGRRQFCKPLLVMRNKSSQLQTPADTKHRNAPMVSLFEKCFLTTDAGAGVFLTSNNAQRVDTRILDGLSALFVVREVNLLTASAANRHAGAVNTCRTPPLAPHRG